MKPRIIGYGLTIPGPSFKNVKPYFEAELESWENEEESLRVLKQKCLRVALELGWDVNDFIKEDEKLIQELNEVQEKLDKKHQQLVEKHCELEKLKNEYSKINGKLIYLERVVKAIKFLDQYETIIKLRELENGLFEIMPLFLGEAQQSETKPEELKEECDPIPFEPPVDYEPDDIPPDYPAYDPAEDCGDDCDPINAEF